MKHPLSLRESQRRQRPAGALRDVGPAIGLLLAVALSQVAPVAIRPLAMHGRAAESTSLLAALNAKAFAVVKLPTVTRQGELRPQEFKSLDDGLAPMFAASPRFRSPSLATSSLRSMPRRTATLVDMNVRLQI
ncbi:hypothetical protein Poly24_52010 [Rosistilla carotiformis]|uniref:Uncharacterized protein n=1 Tax=Rosistilla carotiformis TaxID=2528017 RepID=A0A518K136_9BACT|nr:hypothetical protein [Rosistilla carotiformis]QDV71465.1 hypothetical protein Poly24_52010 [Rosistilla carotiformis]